MQRVTPRTTYADEWRERLLLQPSTPPEIALCVAPGDRVVFVGAHPDDETFAAGATLSALARIGAAVHVVCITSGEAAYPPASEGSADLPSRRRLEFREACARLGVTSGVVLDLPDSDVSSHLPEATENILRIAAGVSATHLLTVWWCDPHPDHEAVGWATRDVGERLELPVSGFPVWAHHWTEPDDTLPVSTHVIALDAAHRERRRRAQAAYMSQSTSPSAGLEPVLPPWFLKWDIEYAMQAP